MENCVGCREAGPDLARYNRDVRAVSFRAAVLLVAFCGIGCAEPDSETDGAPDQGTEPVALSVSHRTEWRVLWVEGETDLPDGAFVNYSVTHTLARTMPAEEWPAANLIDSGRATVQDGQYWTRINTINWPPGEVEVLVQFPLPPQPPAVMERFGEFGEHLMGANVTDLGGIKAVEVIHVFEHTRR